MCGIFGAIGKGSNPAIIRALALINRERGTDSMGFFDSTGAMIKFAADPLQCLGRADFNDWINRACHAEWFVAGHTRHATKGSRTTPNSHPFRYGDIIGAHNGMVDDPYDRKYAVDSEYLFDQLNRHNGNYQAALADISGYWGLAWYDGKSFYLQAHKNTICIARAHDGALYFSSDGAHLAACIGGDVAIVKMGSGDTFRFDVDSDNPTILDPFVSTVKPRVWDTSLTSTTTKRALPPVTTISPATSKRKKRKKRKTRVVFGRNDSADYLSYDDYDRANDLADLAGYENLDTFMEIEGLHDERAALRMLEDADNVQPLDSDGIDHFATSDDWRTDSRNAAWAGWDDPNDDDDGFDKRLPAAYRIP